MNSIYFQIRAWGRWVKEFADDPLFPSSKTKVGAYSEREGVLFIENGAQEDEYAPATTNPNLQQEFRIRVVDHPTAIEFVKDYGFLGLPDQHFAWNLLKSESVSEILKLSEEFRTNIEKARKLKSKLSGRELSLALAKLLKNMEIRSRVKFRLGPKDELRFDVSPITLADWMRVMTATEIFGSRFCVVCGKSFPYDKKAKQGGKRTCDQNCTKAAWLAGIVLRPRKKISKSRMKIKRGSK